MSIFQTNLSKKQHVLKYLSLIVIILIFCSAIIYLNNIHDLNIEISPDKEKIYLEITFIRSGALISGTNGDLAVNIENENGTILWELKNYKIRDLYSFIKIIYWEELDPEPPSNCSYELILKCWFHATVWFQNDKFYSTEPFVRP